MDVRVAAYGLIVEGSRILLAHWNEHGHSGWTLPGGGLLDGEDPADAAVREIREETGYDAILGPLLGIDSRVIPEAQRIRKDGSGPLHTLRIVYRAHVIGGVLTNEVDESTDEAAWHEVARVAALRHVSLVDAALRMSGLAAR